MPPIPQSMFRRRLRKLDAGDLAAFVADLWAARGYETSVEGDTCQVERPDDLDRPEQTLSVHHVPYIAGRIELPWQGTIDGGNQTPTPTVVVTNAPERSIRHELGTDVDVIDADDLYEITLYAIPRDRCRYLLREHLGIREPVPSAAQETETKKTSAEEVTSSAVVWALIAVVAIAFAAGVFLTNDISTQTTIGSTAAPDGGGVSPPHTARSGASSTVSPTPSRTALAPGLNRDGISNANRLAKAHEAAITGSAYTWVLSYREYGPNRTTVTLNETVRVISPAFYVNEVHRDGKPQFSESTFVSRREFYANDRIRLERILLDNGTRYRRTSIDGYGFIVGRNADRAEKYVRRFLTAETSTVVRGHRWSDRTLYLVKATGDPRADITNATTVAWIDSHGLVHELHRTYQPANVDNVTVEIRFRYVNIGNTTVNPPPWYDAARNATD